MPRIWTSSSGNVGISARISGCFLMLLFYGLALLGVIGIIALIIGATQ